MGVPAGSIGQERASARLENEMELAELFKALIGKFIGMTKPYPKGKLFGLTIDHINRRYRDRSGGKL